jgi:hypothetical protein
MKQKFLRIKTDDVQFDVPMPDNAIMVAIAESLQTKGFLVFEHLWVPRESIRYACLYDMEVEKSVEPSSGIDFTKPPEGFKPS